MDFKAGFHSLTRTVYRAESLISTRHATGWNLLVEWRCPLAQAARRQRYSNVAGTDDVTVGDMHARRGA
jgi:G:T-mismatch repair DNA endonuclease (very short patch repair protein)